MAAAFQNCGNEIEAPMALEYLDQHVLELGSLVARLAEETEDDFELDLRIRSFIESGRVHVLHRRIPCGAASFGEVSFLEN